MNISQLCLLKLPNYKEKCAGVENDCKYHIWISKHLRRYTTNIKNHYQELLNQGKSQINFPGTKQAITGCIHNKGHWDPNEINYNYSSLC
jgi:hypothetical protein